MKAWLKAHKAIGIVLGAIVLWGIYRALSGGLLSASSGHASPEDAISYGWSVYQAGISGWLEVSPDGTKSIMHDTGWAGDPYRNGAPSQETGTS